MAETYAIVCPSCDMKLKVNEEVIGKKIRCKGCQHVFVVQKPTSTKPAAKKPVAKKAAASEPEPEEEAKGLSPHDAFVQRLAEEEAQGDNPYGLGHVDEGIARCPRCANAMESETAVVCLHCGFNTKTRTRADTKMVFENTGGDVFKHRLPGIICAVLAASIIIFDIVFIINLKPWSANWDFLKNEDGSFWLKPGIFGLYGSIAMFMIWMPLSRFAYKRLVINNRPPEKQLKI